MGTRRVVMRGLPLPHQIENRILEIRGMRVMLDSDLAAMYVVTTGSLNQAVSRNIARFPSDFMFQLSRKEWIALISQSVISNGGRGGRRRPPRVFTEQGVAMLSSVLRSERAIAVNIAVMRAFVHLRGLALTHQDLARRIDALEHHYDGKFAMIFGAIKRLIAPPRRRRRPIGFR